MICMATMVYVPAKETVVSEGGVYLRAPIEGDRIGQPLHSEESVDCAMEERKNPPDDVEYLQRIADNNDLNRSL